MPIPVSTEYRIQSRRKRNFGALYSALILLSLHWSLVLYVNSSFLEQFLSGATVGVLYTIGSLITIGTFLLATRILPRIGNYTLTIFFATLECLVLIGMALTGNVYLAVLFFMVHQVAAPLILFSIDIFMEEMTEDEEGSTGGRRGLLLTIMSLTGALAVLLGGYLLGDEVPQFSLVYSMSALLLIPFILIVMRYFKTFEDPRYQHFKFMKGLLFFWHRKDVRNVFFAHFTLQVFFAWMVIYTPLYLATIIGFNWEEIGQILFVGLMAYVFLEYGIGVIADKWIGEKEMMALGFVTMAVSTSWFVFLDDSSVGAWMLAMFLTRVGASLVETTTESYFFKHIRGDDSNLISFFRITRPLSYVIGAFLGSITLAFLNFNLLFVVLGLLMIPGLFFTMALKDTK